MIARGFEEADLMDCLDLQTERMGTELVGRPRAIRAWKNLIGSRSFNSSVIEIDPPRAGDRIAGFGAAVFVRRDFIDYEISHPRPGLNARIIASIDLASIDPGRSVVLSDAELRRANTKGGLDLVCLYGSWKTGILGENDLATVHALLAARFVEDHAGYRLNRIVSEWMDEPEKYHFVQRSHVLRIISNYEDFYKENPVEERARHAMAIMTKEDALSVNGSLLNELFHYREPVLRLRDAERRLLIAALGGLTDDDLSRKLAISLPAVKKRWRSIFDRVTDLRPDLFAGFTQNLDSQKRGRQKRHLVLTYVRAHPEELRPTEREERRLSHRVASGSRRIRTE